MPRLITEADVFAARERAYSGKGEGVAQALREWATDAERFTLAEGVSRAAVLLEAAENFAYAGDYAEALPLFEEARLDGGSTYTDPRALMVQSLYESGQKESALDLANALRKDRPAQVTTYIVLAGYFELAGELELSQRWYAMGIRAMDTGRVQGTEAQYETMLMRRRGVRGELGIDLDTLDEAAEIVRERGHLPSSE